MKLIITVFFILFTLSFANSARADLIPDKLYLNLATKHFGMGEEVFGIEGPNEFNPGIGLGFEDIGPGLLMTGGLYKDSFGHLAYTGGVSYPIIKRDHFMLTSGLSFTASLQGEAIIQKRSETNPDRIINEIVKPRRYAWPYLSMHYRNFYVQLRPGINKEKEPAGVFSFGLSFDLKPLFDRTRAPRLMTSDKVYY